MGLGDMELEDLWTASELRELHRSQYVEDGRVVFSSRTRAARYPEISLGAWRYEDSHRGLHGTEVAQLVEFHPKQLDPGEFDWGDPEAELRRENRLTDAKRYAVWLKQGLQAPPVEVVERDDGKFRVTDGHRRLYAAYLARRPVRAWVSWRAPHPHGLRDAATGKVMGVGLTHEIAQELGW